MKKNGRKTTLTHFGEEFLDCAERTLSTLDAGIESIQRSANGEGLIRLGLLRTLGVEFVPRLAAGFLKENPNLDIQFTFHTGVTKSLLDGLTARKFDLVFCSKPSAELNLTAVRVQKQNLVLIVPKDHPLADYHSIDLAKTAPYPQIFFETSSGIRAGIEQMFAQIGM